MKSRCSPPGFWLTICLLLVAAPVCAQGWRHTFADLSQPYAVQPTPDGGLAFVATMQNAGINRDLVVVKTDAAGREQWAKNFGGPGDDEGRSLALTLDGQALVVTGRKSFAPNNGDVWLAKLGLDGALLWERTFNFGVLDDPCCLRPTPDGGYLVALEADDQLRLLKTDADGLETWSLAYPQTLGHTVEHLEITPDGGFLLTLLWSNPPIAAPIAVVLKTDAAGTLVFENAFQHFTTYGTTEIARAKPLGAEQYLLAHRDSIYRLDAAGQFLDGWRIAAANNFYATDFVPAADGGCWVLGTDYSYNPPSSRLVLERLAADGTPVWTRNLLIPNYAHSTWAAAQHPDGGFSLTGNFIHDGDYFSYLLRTDSLGQIFSNKIAGEVYWDKNQNCAPAPGEPPLAGRVVRIAHPNGELSFASTDSLGHYEAPAGLGAHTVSVVPANALWAADCAQGETVSFDTTFVTAEVPFPLRHTADCPLTWVDAGVANWLPCMENTVVVRYANQGTSLAAAAEVSLVLDSLLTVAGASIPFEQTGPFAWRFPLGDLAALQNGTFTVQVVPACDGLTIGQTKCLTVHITPDAPCLAPLDGPLIAVEGRCDADSVRFRVLNKGAGMNSPLEFIVIEGDIMFLQGQFQLGPGGETIRSFPANGSTWRLEARQAPGTPDWQSDALVAAAVEGCTTSGAFSMGFVNQYSLFDGGNFSETECREVVGAPGGLAKIAYPGGYDTQHFIAANTDLEYALHFQNTGADTARFAVLRDTLDAALLNASSVQPGPASHLYTMIISDLGVLSFYFDSLLLPPGGTGWVKFRVAQQADLPNGTIIYNCAAAIFDYGAPAWTNETFHTIAAPLVSVFNAADGPKAPPGLKVWPVPAAGVVWLEMRQAGRYRATLHEENGRVVLIKNFTGQQCQLPLDGLPPGVFVLSVWSDSGQTGVVRILKID